MRPGALAPSLRRRATWQPIALTGTLRSFRDDLVLELRWLIRMHDALAYRAARSVLFVAVVADGAGMVSVLANRKPTPAVTVTVPRSTVTVAMPAAVPVRQ